MTIEEAGRILDADLDNFVWHDSQPAPEGNDGTEKFEYKPFEAERDAYPFLLGDLTIEQLVARVRAGDVKEVIMATNPNMAGDGTILYISSLLRNTGVKITRLARGLPTGSSIEFASGKMLADAIIGRQELE